MDLTMIEETPMLIKSKNLVFEIFSYVDTAPVVCYRVILILNKRFNELAKSKENEAINLLKKPNLKIKIDNLADLIKLDRINLLYFNFGFEVKAVHFTALLKRLKQYPNPHVLTFEHGLTIDGFKPSRANKQIS